MSQIYKKSFQPTAIGDFVFSNPTSKAILDMILRGGIKFPANNCGICFHGTYGSGKTTLAKMLPNLLEGSGKLPTFQRTTNDFAPYDWVHFSACGIANNTVSSSQNMVKRVYDDLLGAASGWHYEILDEADLLTDAAQASLKALADPDNGTIFLLTTNNIQKIDAGLRNRLHLIQMDQPNARQLRQLGHEWMRSVGLTGNELTSENWDDMIKKCCGFRDFGDTMEAVCQTLLNAQA